MTNSGLTAPGNRIKLEGGSFGWQKQTLSTGGVAGNADYYVSVDNARRDGYQDFTFTKAKGWSATSATASTPSSKPVCTSATARNTTRTRAP